MSSKFEKDTIKMFNNIKADALEALNIPIELDSIVKKLNSEKTKVRIFDVIQDTLKQKETRGIQIIFDNLDNLPEVCANFALLKEVLNELINNAIKAMPDGGKIKISANRAQPNMLEINVQDTGHGIPQEIIENIFKYGFTQWPKARGDGSGLAMLKTVIEVDHKGQLSVESIEDKGSIFKVSLPIYL
jgi:signal transduction histidine kinase